MSDLTHEQYASLAAFRFALRRFLAFSEAEAGRAGLPPQQHQALLALRGAAGGEPPSVGYLAAHLMIAPHSAAELVARMEASGLLTKARATVDRRRVELTPTAKALELLQRLSVSHLAELRLLEPVLRDLMSAAEPAPP